MREPPLTRRTHLSSPLCYFPIGQRREYPLSQGWFTNHKDVYIDSTFVIHENISGV